VRMKHIMQHALSIVNLHLMLLSIVCHITRERVEQLLGKCQAVHKLSGTSNYDSVQMTHAHGS
jgi:hypothetical protein